MSVAHNVIPARMLVLLEAGYQSEITNRTRMAEQRALAQIHSHRRRAKHAAQSIQWLQSEANAHVTICPCSNFGESECPEFRQLRADIALAKRRYGRALKRLNGGR